MTTILMCNIKILQLGVNENKLNFTLNKYKINALLKYDITLL